MTKSQFAALLVLGAFVALVLLASAGEWALLGKNQSTIGAPWLRMPALIALALLSYPYCSLLYPAWSAIESAAFRVLLLIPLAIILALLSLALPVAAVFILGTLA